MEDRIAPDEKNMVQLIKQIIEGIKKKQKKQKLLILDMKEGTFGDRVFDMSSIPKKWHREL